jgi:hypothetical protein
VQSGLALPFQGEITEVLYPTALRWVVTHCPCRAEKNLQSYWVDVYLTDFLTYDA